MCKTARYLTYIRGEILPVSLHRGRADTLFREFARSKRAVAKRAPATDAKKEQRYGAEENSRDHSRLFSLFLSLSFSLALALSLFAASSFGSPESVDIFHRKVRHATSLKVRILPAEFVISHLEKSEKILQFRAASHFRGIIFQLCYWSRANSGVLLSLNQITQFQQLYTPANLLICLLHVRHFESDIRPQNLV